MLVKGRPMSALGQKQTFAAQNGMSALHPKADMCGATRDVRFGPEADICAAAKLSYSITSSARASSDCGTVSPSAFAVFRLMPSSYYVGARTGRSLGFSPLIMRLT